MSRREARLWVGLAYLAGLIFMLSPLLPGAIENHLMRAAHLRRMDLLEAVHGALKAERQALQDMHQILVRGLGLERPQPNQGVTHVTD